MEFRTEANRKPKILQTYSDLNSTDEQYGTIFDISEPSDLNDVWREIKITFIKNGISQTEYLNFDKSIANLYDSVDEVLNSIKRFLDKTNFEIVHMYLLDVTRSEYLLRISNQALFLSLRPLVPLNMKYKRNENTELRAKYKELSGTDMGHQLILLIKKYESTDYGDTLTDTLNLLYMQKLAISLNIHQVACEHAMVSMRKSLDIPIKSEEVKEKIRKSDNTHILERRISEIISKKDKGEQKKEKQKSKSIAEGLEDKKFSLRDACECIIV